MDLRTRILNENSHDLAANKLKKRSFTVPEELSNILKPKAQERDQAKFEYNVSSDSSTNQPAFFFEQEAEQNKTTKKSPIEEAIKIIESVTGKKIDRSAQSKDLAEINSLSGNNNPSVKAV